MYAAAVLEQRGIKTDIIDAIALGLSFDEYAKKIEELSPEVVVLETSTPSFSSDLVAARVAKESGARVVMVGPHPSIFYEEILRNHREVDICGIGEYDYTVADVSEAMLGGKLLDTVSGIVFRDDGEGIKKTPNRPLIEDLDELPYPARHLVPMDNYIEPIIMNSPFATEITSRGCPYQCIFCLYPSTMYGHKFRARRASKVVDEMEFLIDRYKVKEIFFDDDTFTVNRKRVLAICEEIKKRGVDVAWSCLSRVNTVDREVLKVMKDAGCVLIRYGVETASQDVLDFAKKGITIKQVWDTFKWTKEVGIRTHATMMFGLPGDNSQNIKETVKFVKELDPDFAQFAICTPYPGTEFYDIARDKGWLKANDWEDFVASGKAVVETNSLSGADLERAVIDAYKEFYLRPSYALKRMFSVRSFCEMKKILSEVQVLFRSLFFEGGY